MVPIRTPYAFKYFFTRLGLTLLRATATAIITQRMAIPLPAIPNNSLDPVSKTREVLGEPQAWLLMCD